MSGNERVQVAVQAGVLTATLNRPEKRNAIDTPMIDALLAALQRADLDAAVRVVALRGAGPDFCAGMDLNELLASADQTAEENRRAALHFGEFLQRRPFQGEASVGRVRADELRENRLELESQVREPLPQDAVRGPGFLVRVRPGVQDRKSVV